MIPLILPSTPETPIPNPAPRQDFVLLAESLGCSLLHPARRNANSLLTRLEKRTATDIRQAFAALKRRRNVSAYLSLSEKVGIPLALLLPRSRGNRPAHVLIGHRLTSPNKRGLHERTGYLHRFDRIMVLATTQSIYLTGEAGYPADRAAFVYDAVDTEFWAGGRNANLDGQYILAVGRERRDYATFAEALRRLPDARAVVVASSPWSRAEGAPLSVALPPNMTFREKLSYAALRDLYAGASLVVVPLEMETDYAAGVSTCLEAMAMGKAILATATPGLADYHRDDAGTALLATVPVGEPVEQMRDAMESLLADPARREGLALAGRRFVRERANMDMYVMEVSRAVREATGEA